MSVDRERCDAATIAFAVFERGLLLQFAERDDRGERRDGDGDADEAQDDAQSVRAKLRPGLAQCADDAGGDA